MLIRAIDGGGAGLRRADVDGTKIFNYQDTGKDSPPKTREELLSFAIDSLMPGTQGIAYSMAGIIDEQDHIVNSPNIRFLIGMNLATETAKKTGMKTAVYNDMEAAVSGMAALVPGEKYFLGITWSSGIGLRVWSDGKILSVAEGGHIVIDPSPFAPICGCGKQGHAEAIVGGNALRRKIVTEMQTLDITDFPNLG